MATHDALLDLALWKAPQQSGAVLVAATGFYFVFEKLQYTLLALVAQALLVAVLGCAIWTTFCRFTNRPTPAVPKLEVSEARVRSAVSAAVVAANDLLALVYKLGTGQDPKHSAQVIVGLYFASKVAGWFSFLTLAYLVTLAFFSVPKLYEKNQSECDKLLATAEKELKKLYEKLPELPKAQKVTKKAD